jgi:NADH pyrophosphatase NudC (nudix superfamily)
MNYNFCPTCKADLAINKDNYLGCTNSECSFVHYENPTPVVAAIVEYGENQVILAHNVQWPPSWYAVITGFLEKHEDPAEAILREVKEELNLDGVIGEFIGHYPFKRMNQLIIAYHVKATGTIQLNDELDDYKIIPFEKVKTWPSGTGKALKHFLEKRGYEVEERPFS